MVLNNFEIMMSSDTVRVQICICPSRVNKFCIVFITHFFAVDSLLLLTVIFICIFTLGIEIYDIINHDHGHKLFTMFSVLYDSKWEICFSSFLWIYYLLICQHLYHLDTVSLIQGNLFCWLIIMGEINWWILRWR